MKINIIRKVKIDLVKIVHNKIEVKNVNSAEGTGMNSLVNAPQETKIVQNVESGGTLRQFV